MRQRRFARRNALDTFAENGMLGYYLDLALRSLKRNTLLTALMIVAIGFGVAASMITYSVFRAVSGNPIPDKSAQLFTPQIDSWGPQQSFNGDGEPPQALDYTDAMALMRAHAAKRQTLLYPVQVSLMPGATAACRSRRTATRCTPISSRCSKCHSNSAVAGTRRRTKAARR